MPELQIISSSLVVNILQDDDSAEVQINNTEQLQVVITQTGERGIQGPPGDSLMSWKSTNW